MNEFFDFFSHFPYSNNNSDQSQNGQQILIFEEDSQSPQRMLVEDSQSRANEKFKLLELKAANQSTELENYQKRQEINKIQVCNEPEIGITPDQKFEENHEEFLVKIYPKETKNYYKNQITGFQSFITENAQNLKKDDPTINEFQRLKVNGRCLKRLLILIKKSSKLRQIAAFYFGQYAWSQNFIKNNKVNIEPYCRLNKLLYKRRNIKKQ